MACILNILKCNPSDLIRFKVDWKGMSHNRGEAKAHGSRKRYKCSQMVVGLTTSVVNMQGVIVSSGDLWLLK